MSDHGKAILHEEKRKERSKEVSIRFVDEGLHHFDVLDEQGAVKYRGIIMGDEPHRADFCGCDSLYFGNGDEYKKANPASFQCKHLHRARDRRKEAKI